MALKGNKRKWNSFLNLGPVCAWRWDGSHVGGASQTWALRSSNCGGHGEAGGSGEAEQGENAHPLTLKGDLAYLGAHDQGPDLVHRPSEGPGQQGWRRR